MKTISKSKTANSEKSNDDLMTRPMIPLQQCRDIMNRRVLVYTDEELILIRQPLRHLSTPVIY